MPHRSGRAVVGSAVGCGNAAAAAVVDGGSGAPADRRRERTGADARSAVDARETRSRLHRRVSARCAGKRRSVFARRRLDADGAGRARRRRRRVSDVQATQPGASIGAPATGSALSTGTVCDGRRRLHASAVHRPRRLELVHGFRRVDVPRRHRVDLRTTRARRPHQPRTAPAVALAANPDDVASRRARARTDRVRIVGKSGNRTG